jgi:ATP-dependent DNA helicase DinG
MPDIPAVSVAARHAALMTSDGEIHVYDHARIKQMIGERAVLACHAPFTARRLDMPDLKAFDVLELFAFVYPGAFCVPTPAGLARALGLSPADGLEDYPLSLTEAAQTLLTALGETPDTRRQHLVDLVAIMGLQGKGWPWTPYVQTALGFDYDPAYIPDSRRALKVWQKLPEWAEEPPPQPPSHHGVAPDRAESRLEEMLARLPGRPEPREAQRRYARHMTSIFAPLAEEGAPHIALAEAGTGVGKTLAYLAPAAEWAEANDGAVWVSTYTRNLQRQIEGELETLYPDRDRREADTAVRKGRENYLCLLNYEDMANTAALAHHPRQAIAAGLMARWIEGTRDGDLTGRDFPGWLKGLLGAGQTLGLADRRGECIYSACDHYHRCFVEGAARKSKHARIVVANHALVMINTAVADASEQLPRRYIFDEGHHLFDAADSAFAGHLTGRETRDLRRWLLGAEGGQRSRARGLQRRAEDLVTGDEEGAHALDTLLVRARALPGEGWLNRVRHGQPQGAIEGFLTAVYAQVRARSGRQSSTYSLECETRPLNDDVPSAARKAYEALAGMRSPGNTLMTRLQTIRNNGEDTLNADTRRRLEAVIRGLQRRLQLGLQAWLDMLDALLSAEIDERFVDWLAIDRMDGRIMDIGMYRHWINPMQPFAAAIQPQAGGIAVTSATLRDGSDDEAHNWAVARRRTGADLMNAPPQEVALNSPFDYTGQTRVLVVTDIDRDDTAQVASAMRGLFRASGGGALGLFTAIQRLRAVHGEIAGHLEEAGLPLYAQHVDGMDIGTLVDMFRDDMHACLMGTDAVRDGIDVPGEALRLLVFDRVPWPRPSILHKARRQAFGRRSYDDLLTRLRLKQAYGRLIRSQDDRGVFVMLDSRLPTRLTGAFPVGVEVQRVGLKEAIETVHTFLGVPASREEKRDQV